MAAKLGSRRRTGLLTLAGAAIIAGAAIAIATAPHADGKAHARRPASRHAVSSRAPAGVTRRQLVLAASYLGLSASALRRHLHGGESLGQVAASTRGRSPHGLLEALVRRRIARIEAERARGALSAEHAHRRIERLRERAQKALSHAGGG